MPSETAPHVHLAPTVTLPHKAPGSLPKASGGPGSQPTGNPHSQTGTGAAPHPVTLLTKQMPGCQDGRATPVPSDSLCLPDLEAELGLLSGPTRSCRGKWEQ